MLDNRFPRGRGRGLRLTMAIALAWSALPLLPRTAAAQPDCAPGMHGDYTPQQVYHGYYPTIWRTWPAGWQPKVKRPVAPPAPARPTPAAPTTSGETPPGEDEFLPPEPPSGPAGELPLPDPGPGLSPLPGAPPLPGPPTTPTPTAPGVPGPTDPTAPVAPPLDPTAPAVPTEPDPLAPLDPSEPDPLAPLPGDEPAAPGTDPGLPPGIELPESAPEATPPQSRERGRFRPQPRLIRPMDEVTQDAEETPEANQPAAVRPAGATEPVRRDGWSPRSSSARRPAHGQPPRLLPNAGTANTVKLAPPIAPAPRSTGQGAQLADYEANGAAAPEALPPVAEDAPAVTPAPVAAPTPAHPLRGRPTQPGTRMNPLRPQR